LPADLENGPPASQYLGPEAFRNAGPARVLLGSWEGVQSQIVAPSGITYLDVNLRSGDSWTFTPPSDHTVTWIAVHKGAIQVGDEQFSKGEFVAFEPSSSPLHFTAQAGSGFILGSAIKHPYDLHCGYYSVHTSPQALQRGENRIAELSVAHRHQETSSVPSPRAG
jgi:redox-sensitive bicupin YhaK (pirin superfamily)